MRSSRRGQPQRRSAFSRPARPSRRRPSGPASTSRRIAAATASGVAGRDQEPGLAVVDHRPHARVLGGDRRQPAGHRLDQDDPERLRRLGGEQEQVGGPQDARQLGVGDARRGSGRARRPRRRRPGARKPSSSSPPPGDDQMRTRSSPQPRADRLDRDVEPLEVVGAVERGDEGRDHRVVRDAEPRAQPASSAPGANSSVSTPFGISISFAGRARRCRRR